MTTAADPAALTPIGRQPQAAISPKSPPSTGPTSRRLTLEVHTPTAPNLLAIPQATSHINHSPRQTGYSSSVADEFTRAGGLLAVHGVPRLTQSPATEPGVRHGLPGKQQAVALPLAVILTKFTFKPGVRPVMVMGQSDPSSARQGGPVARRAAAAGSGSGEPRKDIDIAARSHEKGDLCQALELSLRCPSLSNPDLTPTLESEPQSESKGGEAALLEEQAGGGHRQEVDVAARSHEEEEPLPGHRDVPTPPKSSRP